MKKEDIEAYLAAEREQRDKMSNRDLLIRIDERTLNQDLRAQNHARRIERIELAIVGSLLAIIGWATPAKEALSALFNSKGHQ